MEMKKYFFTSVTFIIAVTLHAQTFQLVKDLAERRVPWLASSLQLSKINSENGNDVFELSSLGNKINIAANNANAAAMGLGWYLKYYCNKSMSHLGDNLSAPQQIPFIKNKVKIVSPFGYRYALNYCTISYSMAFYKWKDWERELDWMALNGVNLMLAPIGTEAVWQNTLMQFGYSQKETLDFLAHPAYLAWWLMGNLEGEGGKLSQGLVEQQKLLQQKIVQRMNHLGINPVLQGFYGMVPTTLKNKMKINVVEQGRWAGGYQRPDFLLPTDSFFTKMANVYYSEIKKLYGSNIRFFGGEPFHEGGNTSGIDVSHAAKIVQDVMLQNFANSTWVLQGWQGNPSDKLLNDLQKKNTLIIELFGENTANWEERKAYGGIPFVWCNVSNFGEKVGLYSKLQRFASEVYRAKNSSYGTYMKGIGIIPEGIYNNPVNPALMFELAWRKDSVVVSDWIKGYTKYRYGKADAAVQNAWKGLLATVYSSPTVYQEGTPESIFCARPALQNKPVSTWGTRKRNYDTKQFEAAVKRFVSANDVFKTSETFQTDKIDFVRQVLANKGDDLYLQIIESVKNKNETAFKKQSQLFLQMILMQDSLLSVNKYFRLNRWLQQAKDFGKMEYDKKQAIRNAKMQITIWGPQTNAATDLHEYAHKEWNGLLGSLYYNRWKLFFENELQKLQGKKTEEINFFEIEKQWMNKPDLYNTKSISPTQLQKIIAEILK